MNFFLKLKMNKIQLFNYIRTYDLRVVHPDSVEI